MLGRIRSARLFGFTRTNFTLNLYFHSRLKSSSRDPSSEQNAIVEALKECNVIVSARPGSGKTTAAEAVVKVNRDSRILILTYSKRLQLRTQQKLAGYHRTDVCTFHSFAGKLFATPVTTDQCLRELRKRNAQPVWMPPYDFVILDELQDLTEILFWLTCTLLSGLARSLPSPPKLLLLGDPRQAIYGYQGADPRFLEFAEQLFSEYSPYPWENRELPKSHRLSHQTASFVNACTGDKYIEGSRDGPRPIYIRCNPWDIRGLAKKIHPIIERYSAENCAIIAPSVKTNIPLALLTNRLSSHYGLRVAEPVFDNGPLDIDVLHGKLVVSTYHQFKGLERKLVIVLGVDGGFFQYIDRSAPNDRCPNPMFVAFTRASKQLVVIQSELESAIPFVSWVELKNTCDYIEIPYASRRQPKKIPKEPSPVTDITRNVASEILEQLVEKHAIKTKVAGPLPYSSCIDVPDKVLTDREVNSHELVSDLSGIAVTAAFEWSVSSTCSAFRNSEDFGAPFTSTKKYLSPRWFAKEAARHSAQRSHYTPRLNELTKSQSYDWLHKCLPRTNARLLEQFPNTSSLAFEQVVLKTVKHRNSPISFQYTDIIGQLDIIESSSIEGESPTIWEIKLVSLLSVEHFAQVIIYGFLWFAEQTEKSKRELKFPRLVLFNVRDGTKWEISTTFGDATTFTREALRARERIEEPISDVAFLERCKQVREEVARGRTGMTPPESV